MTTKHDEAPWTLHRDQSGWYVSPVEALLPTGDAESGKDDDGRYLANALLVTAAPDLFRALEQLADAVREGRVQNRHLTQAYVALGKAALVNRAAVAGGGK